MAGANGGRRPGAGRPKGSRNKKTIIRDKAIADAGADAEYAFGLFVQGMRGELADKSVILYCAREVMDRVWGRPTQHKIVDATVDVVKEYVGWSPENWDDDEEENDEESGALQAMEMADSTPE